jgi:hypothetical protein
MVVRLHCVMPGKHKPPLVHVVQFKIANESVSFPGKTRQQAAVAVDIVATWNFINNKNPEVSRRVLLYTASQRCCWFNCKSARRTLPGQPLAVLACPSALPAARPRHAQHSWRGATVLGGRKAASSAEVPPSAAITACVCVLFPGFFKRSNAYVTPTLLFHCCAELLKPPIKSNVCCVGCWAMMFQRRIIGGRK